MSSFTLCPSPWTLKGDVYILPFLASPSDITPELIYDPLEASSPAFADSKPLGGFAMVQIIRYSESPVGPYDELLLVPGNVVREKGDKKGIRTHYFSLFTSGPRALRRLIYRVCSSAASRGFFFALRSYI